MEILDYVNVNRRVDGKGCKKAGHSGVAKTMES